MTYLRDFISLVYPDLCQVCGKSLFKGEKIVCLRCYRHLPRSRFSNYRDNPAAQLFWGRAPLNFVFTAFLYNKGNAIQQLIHAFKYRGIKNIGIFLGEELGNEINVIDSMKDLDYIVPVPLHPRKMKKRGFNQSEIIARGIEERTGASINTTIIKRKSFTSTQTRKSKYERWQNVENIFQAEKPEAIEGKHILLVDDVITTGATIEACIQALLKAKGIKISAVAIAYTRG